MYINSWYRRVIRYASISIAALIVIQMMAVTHIDIYLENKIQSEVEALSKEVFFNVYMMCLMLRRFVVASLLTLS